jgi:hypothetical protein
MPSAVSAEGGIHAQVLDLFTWSEALGSLEYLRERGQEPVDDIVEYVVQHP